MSLRDKKILAFSMESVKREQKYFLFLYSNSNNIRQSKKNR